MSESTCKSPECMSAELWARGLCLKHYNYHRVRGTLGNYPAKFVHSKERHTLRNINEKAMAAHCTVCGPVSIARLKAKGKFECKRRQRTRAGLTAEYVSTQPGMSDREKFEFYGWEVGDHGCWNWLGGLHHTGYGYCPKNSFGTRLAHRFSYQLHFGKIERHYPVHHICANRACVNPMHLQRVDQRENTAEMMHRNAYLAEIRDLKKQVRELKAEIARHKRSA